MTGKDASYTCTTFLSFANDFMAISLLATWIALGCISLLLFRLSKLDDPSERYLLGNLGNLGRSEEIQP